MSERLDATPARRVERDRVGYSDVDSGEVDPGHQRGYVRGLVQTSAALRGEFDRPAILAHVVALARALVPVEQAAVYDLEPAGSTGALVYSDGPAEPAPTDARFDIEVMGRAALVLIVARPATELAADERALLAGLATAAGSALTTAQRSADAALRQAWLSASAEITSTLLTADPAQSLELVVRAARRLAEARLAWVALLNDAGGARVEASDGVGALSLRGFEIDGPTPLLRDIVSTGQPLVLAAGSVRVGGLPSAMVEVLDGGPIMGIPLSAAGQRRGALIIGNLPGDAPFRPVQVEMASTFASHASLALELAQAELDRRQLTVVAERERIARDLHDVVIQRLFAIGLRIQGLRPNLPGLEADRLDDTVEELDQTIDAIRNTVFFLRTDDRVRTSLRAELFTLVRQAAEALGFTPRLRVLGPIDLSVPEYMSGDVLATVREALSNAARHAGASTVRVEVIVARGDLVLRVSDDGVGLAPRRRESGLANLRHRATALGGSMTTTAGPDGRGTVLVWSAPINRPAPTPWTRE